MLLASVTSCHLEVQEVQFTSSPNNNQNHQDQRLQSEAMAWRCSGETNTALVMSLAKNKLLKTDTVIAAFKQVDRGWFVPHVLQEHAYEDRPLPIGHSVTISAPHMHAMMAEILAPHVRGRDKKILDVGSGSGFLTCVLAAMVDEGSCVVGVEHVPGLVASSANVSSEHFPDWMVPNEDRHGLPRLMFLQGDGLQLCGASKLPCTQFDAIHVGAAAPTVPEGLLSLLAPGGAMVIPVGPQSSVQELLVLSKDAAGRVSRAVDCSVQFVPLTTLQQQLQQNE